MRSLTELWSRPDAGDGGTRTAFVLSGGAAMGALQVGMLRALVERRILPDLILGCSIGAINGVVLAGGPTLQTVGRMQDIWMDLIARELVPTGLLPSPVQLVRKGESISSNDAMRGLLEEIVPAAEFEGLSVPFQCVATDIDTGTAAWFDSGPVVPPVLASSAVPAIFPTVEIGGRRHLDGGIVDDVPIHRAVELGANRIYVLQVGALDRPRRELRRPVDAAFLAYWIARRNRLLGDLARVPDHVEVVLLPHGDPEPVRFDDVSSSAHLMDLSYRASADHLDALADGRLEPTFGPLGEPAPDQLRVRSDEGGFATAHRLFAAARDLIARPGAAERSESDEAGATDSGAPGVAGVTATGPVISLFDTGRIDDTAPPEVFEEPDESRGRLIERAEALGPAMRALITRMFEREADEPGTTTGADHPDPNVDAGVGTDPSADQPAEK